MTTNELRELGQRLEDGAAINALKQAISLIDVRIEASMREMEQFKLLLERVERRYK